MVGRLTLDQVVKVRVLAPQLKAKKTTEGIRKGVVNDAWADYVRGPYRDWLTTNPGFRDEIIAFGGDRLLVDLVR